MLFESAPPALSMSVLKHHGVFSTGGSPVGLTLDGTGFLIWHNEDDDSISIVWKAEERKQQTVQLDRVHIGFGRRPYFVCPFTGARCLVLYFHIAFASAESLGLSRASRTAGRVVRWRAVANRAEARLTGSDGRPPARGRARSAAVRKLQKLGVTSSVAAAAISEVASAEVARLRRQHRHHGGNGTYSTAAALQAGSKAQPSLTSRAIVAYLSSRLGEPATDAGSPVHDRVGLISDYPALDIRELEKTWLLDEDGHWGAVLAWPGGAEAPLTVYLMASFDILDRPALYLEADMAGQVLQQTIELERSRPGTPRRWFMRCPVTAVRKELLYFREGRFASAKAQRLVHPSQRAARAPTSLV